MQDIDLNSNNECRNRPRSGVYGIHQVSETDAKMAEWGVNLAREDAGLSNRQSSASTITLWPRVPGTDSHNASGYIAPPNYQPSASTISPQRRVLGADSDMTREGTTPSICQSSASTITLWPSVPGADSDNANGNDKGKGRDPNSPTHPDEFEMEEVDTSLRRETLPIDLDGFDAEAFNSQLQAELKSWEFERQGRPSDLDKPLPPPPRRGSPMPGRPFDSQNPESDVPKSKYVPRAF